MKEDYNEKVAGHYAAFRPPLHGIILSKLIKAGKRFDSGLDIGCGTGYSSLALANQCDQVIGLDPSISMIEQSVAHPSITYVHGNESKLCEFSSESFDVVTFAGSLFYAKNELLYEELLRTLKPKGTVLVYDFEVLLDEPLAQLGLKQTATDSDYQFIVDLSDWNKFKAETVQTETIELSLTSEELSHVLLADSFIYSLIANHLNQTLPFPHLVEYFQSARSDHVLEAKLYYSRYINA